MSESPSTATVDGQEIPARSVGKGIGHFFGALRIDAFLDPREFKCRIDDWIRPSVRRSRSPASGVCSFPPIRCASGGRAGEEMDFRSCAPVVEELRDISRRTGISLRT